MNFYALVGTRVAPGLLKVALDKGSQDQLSAMLAPLAEGVVGANMSRSPRAVEPLAAKTLR
jgi:hypothetical protein